VWPDVRGGDWSTLVSGPTRDTGTYSEGERLSKP